MVLRVKKIFMSNVTYGVNKQGRRASDRPIFQSRGLYRLEPPAQAGGGMRRNSREVALSSASRDNFQ
jgi:hypothetical protein